MKKMIAALLMVGSVASANEAGWGTEEVIAAGGLTTVVGGCADAQLVQNGENNEVVYTEPCKTAPTANLESDFATIFPTVEAASAACRPGQGIVQAVYNWKFQLQGYQCAPTTDSNGN